MPEEVLRLAGLDKVWTITSTYEDGLKQLGVTRAKTTLGHRVAFPETMGIGKGVQERGKGAWSEEIEALTRELVRRLG